MPVSEAFKVAKGGFTTLAGDFDRGARAQVAKLRREVDAIAGFGLITLGNLVLADNQAAYIEFSAVDTRGVAVFGGSLAAGGSGMVGFRVSASAHISLIASVGATVTVGTGTLAGTTGTDGHLTIRADTASNRLYVENRTGALRNYGFSFLGMRGGTVEGTWVVV